MSLMDPETRTYARHNRKHERAHLHAPRLEVAKDDPQLDCPKRPKEYHTLSVTHLRTSYSVGLCRVSRLPALRASIRIGRRDNNARTVPVHKPATSITQAMDQVTKPCRRTANCACNDGGDASMHRFGSSEIRCSNLIPRVSGQLMVVKVRKQMVLPDMGEWEVNTVSGP